MNITTFSPALVLLYVWLLLWILMGVSLEKLPRIQKQLLPFLFLLVATFNHVLRQEIGAETYGKLIFLTMHLPTFLVFLHITGRGVVKMTFMILTGLVFASPAILIGNLVRRGLFVGSSVALLLSNLISYGILLVIAYVVFRPGFRYLLEHGDDRLFLMFSVVPMLYYIYAFAAMNFDFSSFTSTSAQIIRLLPTINVFTFYFLLIHIYKRLGEKNVVETGQTALRQEFDSIEEQIVLLNQAQTRMAVYQHDMRHHLNMLEGLLAAGKAEQAQEFIQKIQTDLEAITPKRFCENDILNLLCSSFCNKAEGLNVQLTVKANLPKELSVADTELCSILSNGLENALKAVEKLDPPLRWVECYCDIRRNKLLIEIKNPYSGEVAMEDGLPVSDRAGHGFGCRSIWMITRQHRGLCSFEPENGVFTLRVVLPV